MTLSLLKMAYGKNSNTLPNLTYPRLSPTDRLMLCLRCLLMTLCRGRRSADGGGPVSGGRSGYT